MEGLDGDEGRGVDAIDEVFEWRQAETLSDDIKNLARLSGKAASSIHDGQADAELMHDGLFDLLIFRGDDEDRLCFIEADEYKIKHADHDDIRDEGEQGRVPLVEDEPGETEDGDVAEEDDLPDGESPFSISDQP